MHPASFPEREPSMVRNNLGAALLIGGRHDEGVAMLEGVVAEKPEMREAHINLGSFFDEEGVPEKSKHHYRKVSRWQRARLKSRQRARLKRRERARLRRRQRARLRWLGSILLQLLITSIDFLSSPVAPSVSCPCEDARLTHTSSSKLPLSPAGSRFTQPV